MTMGKKKWAIHLEMRTMEDVELQTWDKMDEVTKVRRQRRSKNDILPGTQLRLQVGVSRPGGKG